MCTRLGHTVNTLHELVQTALPVGPSVDNLLRVVTRVYGTLAMLVKYVSEIIKLGVTELRQR